MQISLNTTHADATTQEEKDKLQPMPGPARVRCINVEGATTGEKSKNPGSPQLIFTFELLNNPDFEGREFKWYCPLPLPDRKVRMGNLILVTSALGKPWADQNLETDDYMFKETDAVLEHNDRKFAQIKSFVISG